MRDEEKTIKEIVAEVEQTTRCCCDLDNWEPEPKTGHSWVCDIHKISMNQLKTQQK